MRRDLDEDGADQIREHDVERAVDIRGGTRSRVDRDSVRFGVLFRGAHRKWIGIDAHDLTRATLRRRDREDPRPRADVENAESLKVEVRDRFEALLRCGVEAGAEGHARIEREGDRALRSRVRPCRTDEEPTDVYRRDRRLPRFEPVLIADRADRGLPERAEPPRLPVAE